MHVRSPSAALLADVPVRFYVFDLLHLDDQFTIALRYEQPRHLLDGLGLAGEVVRVPPSFDDGPRARAAAAAYGIEGVVAKRLASPYRPGKRSTGWTKTPFVQTKEVSWSATASARDDGQGPSDRCWSPCRARPGR